MNFILWYYTPHPTTAPSNHNVPEKVIALPNLVRRLNQPNHAQAIVSFPGGWSILTSTYFLPHRACFFSPSPRKLGVALVGLGKYSTRQLAPALQETELCRLAGIVTGTPAQAEAWKETYGLPEKSIYSYENFEQIKYNTDLPAHQQMDSFARSILDTTEPVASGEEGMRDVRIIEAIRQAANTGKRVEIGWGK